MTNSVASNFVTLRLPVQIIGSDLDGRQFIELGHALTIFRGGAMILLANKLAPDSEVIVHNLETNQEALARVVGQIRKEEGSHVYALAFVEHSANLWHIQFPPEDQAGDQRREVVLECSGCRTVSKHAVSEIEMEVLSARRDLTRPCKVCRSSTLWKETTREPSETPQAAPRPPAHPAPAASQARVEERRKNRRTAIRTLVCIRCSGQEDLVTCEDISRGGFRFVSVKEFPEGTHVEAAVPYTESGNNIFSRACIIYSRKTPDGRFRHGVAYLKS